jgi:hypothetical protein
LCRISFHLKHLPPFVCQEEILKPPRCFAKYFFVTHAPIRNLFQLEILYSKFEQFPQVFETPQKGDILVGSISQEVCRSKTVDLSFFGLALVFCISTRLSKVYETINNKFFGNF